MQGTRASRPGWRPRPGGARPGSGGRPRRGERRGVRGPRPGGGHGLGSPQAPSAGSQARNAPRAALRKGSGAERPANCFVGQIVGAMNRSRPAAQVVYDMLDGFIEATRSLARQPLRRATMRIGRWPGARRSREIGRRPGRPAGSRRSRRRGGPRRAGDAGSYRMFLGLTSSSTCWNVGRFVVRIVSGIRPGANSVRLAVVSHVVGSGPRAAARSEAT